MSSETLYPPKAYKNLEFLNSPAARTIRILCEYEHTRQQLRKQGVHDTVVFFGSARIRPPEEATRAVAEAREALAASPDDPDLAEDLLGAEALERLSKYYDQARELAARLVRWTEDRSGPRYVVATGGGPGIMEAANAGASDVSPGHSLGLGISLPFEQGINGYVDPELAFEFHYFFTRKFWFIYLCKAMVAFPGGFGTLDELFEALTLVQTGKVRKRIPMVLFGEDYWSRILDLDAMAEFGTISAHDPELVFRTDDVDQAFDFLTAALEAAEQEYP